jgi:hypothetical protein
VGLSCVNCKADVDPQDVKFFGKIFVCPNCYAIAERLYERGESELKMLLLILHESIRSSIVQGKLQFSPQQLADMKREDLLTHLQTMAREAKAGPLKKESEECPATPISTRTPCKVTMRLPVRSADGKQNSD